MNFTQHNENFAKRLAAFNGNPFGLYILGMLDGTRCRVAWQNVTRKMRKGQEAFVRKDNSALETLAAQEDAKVNG